MRTYKSDSPQAAARLVALALLADGHVGSNELDALNEAQLSKRLGLDPGEFRMIVQGLCEDLMSSSHLNWGNLCRPDSDVMQQLVDELRDPLMRAEVLHLCRTAVQADEHVSEHEFALLHAFADAWQMPCGWEAICRETVCGQRSAARDERGPGSVH
ncbi:MAG TPA: TerB family tellurite resistance protein [Paraburkholderia sp.]|jgi:hypothetical protein